MRWVVYVAVSASSAETYVGITTDVERRLRQHNGVLAGGARTTTRGRPWRVGKVYGPFESRAEAQGVEYEVKRRRGQDRLMFGPAGG